MGRLRRFPAFRYIGRRDLMRVFDCDDETQFERLEGAVTEEDLLGKNLLQSFAPDTLAEARNRGFRPLLAAAAPEEEIGQ
jgi:hypothetical protein